MSIQKHGQTWRVEIEDTCLTWNEQELTWSLQRGGQRWETAPPSEDALCCKCSSELALSPARAVTRRTEPFSSGAQEGVSCLLTDFGALDGKGRLELRLVVSIEVASGDLVVAVDGDVEGGLSLRHLQWPGAIRCSDPATQETIIPFMQGAIIPGDWPHDIRHRNHETNSRGLYMPWWAQRQGVAGYLAILETDDDAGCHFDHPSGGPTAIGPRWEGSLGRFGYQRRARYSFFDKCDYVSICKHYRSYVMRRGRFVSLREKIAATPKVARLIGSPVVHSGIARHVHPESRYFSKDNPEENHQCTPFRTRADQLRALKAKGVETVYLHLDGWGVQGYDSHHPDYLPPNEEAGGWDGFRELAETCQELGYLFALHDQYRDYYGNAPSFDERYAILDQDGNVPGHSVWYGGPQCILCAQLAPGFVLRNHQAIKSQGIPVDGSYLDVFAIVPLEECYHPEHRMTRTECLEARVRCFGIIRDLEGIISSEEPVDFAVRHLHLVHHGPYATEPWIVGAEAQVPLAPLFNLVYHDSLLLPWASAPGKGGWGIPATDCGVSHAALNGGMPYLGIEADEAEIRLISRLCELHKRVALEEMVSHEFLDEELTRQRTAFSDGTTVTANVTTGEWEMM